MLLKGLSAVIATIFRRRAARAMLCSLLLIMSLPVQAWNAAGHRLVASIAWRNLSPEARSEVSDLLREHPDYARWIARATDADIERAAFVECSTWPDEIRKDKRFYSAGVDEATPLLPGFPDMERRTSWHTVKRSLDPDVSAPDFPGEIDKQLVALQKTLKSSRSSALEHRYALPWFIHLAGDSHQPLHSSVRLGPDGRWDKSGHGVTVSNPFNPKKPTSTLHAYWDDLPGPSSLRGEALDSASRALTAVYARPARGASSEQWIVESWEIARNGAYPPGNEATVSITESFDKRSHEIANRRLAEAGYRLADALNAFFKTRKGQQ